MSNIFQYNGLVLFKNAKVMHDKERQKNCSRLKKLKKTWKLNAMCSGLEERYFWFVFRYKWHYWETWIGSMNWMVVLYQCSYPDFDGCALLGKISLKYLGVTRNHVCSEKNMCIRIYVYVILYYTYILSVSCVYLSIHVCIKINARDRMIKHMWQNVSNQEPEWRVYISSLHYSCISSVNLKFNFLKK